MYHTLKEQYVVVLNVMCALEYGLLQARLVISKINCLDAFLSYSRHPFALSTFTRASVNPLQLAETRASDAVQSSGGVLTS
jgi:hypothetical protein